MDHAIDQAVKLNGRPPDYFQLMFLIFSIFFCCRGILSREIKTWIHSDDVNVC